MSDRTFDRAITDWLESGYDRTPPPAIDAVLLAIKTTPQERDLRISRRFNLMPTYMRLAAGLAIAAVLGVAGLTLIRQGNGPGAAPSPTPTSAPTPAATASGTVVVPTDPTSAASITNLDTSTWTAFTSTRYGYAAAYPKDWFVVVATQAWSFETSVVFWSSAGDGADRFISGGSYYHMTAFASTMDAQTTEAAWIMAYGGSNPECPMPADLPAIVIDGHPGRIWTTCWPTAFVAVGRTMFVFSIDDSDDVLLRVFLNTVKLPAA